MCSVRCIFQGNADLCDAPPHCRKQKRILIRKCIVIYTYWYTSCKCVRLRAACLTQENKKLFILLLLLTFSSWSHVRCHDKRTKQYSSVELSIGFVRSNIFQPIFHAMRRLSNFKTNYCLRSFQCDWKCPDLNAVWMIQNIMYLYPIWNTPIRQNHATWIFQMEKMIMSLNAADEMCVIRLSH